jgi:SnoaL-like domain
MTLNLGPLARTLSVVVTSVWLDVDHSDGSGVSAHFTPDATLTFLAHTVRGRPRIDELYARRAARGPRVTRHVMTNLYVRSATETTAEVLSTLCLFAEDGEPPRPSTTPAMVGDVVDHFERHDRRWLISSRHIRAAFVAPNAVLAVPTT